MISPNDFSDDEDFPNIEDYPTLRSVVQFNKLLPTVAWFRSVGTPLTPDALAAARAYADALGFPDCYPAEVEDWHDAAHAAGNPEWNTSWWEAEEQLRAALTIEALDIIGEADLSAALTQISATASPLIQGVVENLVEEQGIEDQELIRAGVGSAIQGCHQAALVLAAGREDDHPFALKYKLFEMGHWPIAITGGSFNIF
jgi:hypothetical protein